MYTPLPYNGVNPSSNSNSENPNVSAERNRLSLERNNNTTQPTAPKQEPEVQSLLYSQREGHNDSPSIYSSPPRHRSAAAVSNNSSANTPSRVRVDTEVLRAALRENKTVPAVVSGANGNTETRLTQKKERKTRERPSLSDIGQFIGMIVHCAVAVFVCLSLYYVFQYAPIKIEAEIIERVNNCTIALKAITRRDEFVSTWRSYAELKDKEISDDNQKFVMSMDCDESSCNAPEALREQIRAYCFQLKGNKTQAFAQRREDLKVDIKVITLKIESKGVLSKDEQEIWNQIQAQASTFMKQDIRDQCEIPITSQVMQKDPIVILERFFYTMKTASSELHWYQTLMLLSSFFCLVLVFISKPLEIFLDIVFVICGAVVSILNLCCKKKQV